MSINAQYCDYYNGAPSLQAQFEGANLPDYSNDTQEQSELRSEFEEAKNNQGLINIFGDTFNNIMGAETSTNNIQREINSLDENSTQEDLKRVQDLIDAYDNDESFLDIAGTGAAMGVGGAAGAAAGAAVGTAICPVVGTIVGALVGVAAGALTNVGIHQVEYATDGKEGNFAQAEDIADDAVSGGVSGLTSYSIGQAASLIKLGAGAKFGVDTAKKEIALSAGSNAIASATITDGRYATDCITGSESFNFADLALTTASSLGGGSVFGATGSNGFQNVLLKFLFKK